MKRSIKLLINKSEITAGTRGASLGPDAVMTAARAKGDTLFSKYEKWYVKDQNELLDKDIQFPNAKRGGGLVKVFKSVSDNIQAILKEGAFPFVLAGDHGSAGGTIAGIKATYPSKRLGVVWIDAHGDLHTPYTTPSGNMHGMPLATALGEDNLEEKSNELSEGVYDIWEALKNTGIDGPKVSAEDIVFIAVRDTERQEDALMERLNITNHTVGKVRELGVSEIMERTLAQLKDCDIIYVSFDVDSMDPKYTSHGTGTPVDNGLKPEEAEEMLAVLARQEKTVCMEFVEVNPCLDEGKNRMAEVTYELFKQTIKELEK